MSPLHQTRDAAAGLFGFALHAADQNARPASARSFAFAHAVFARFTLGHHLRRLRPFRHAPFRVGQIVLGSSEFQRLAFTIGAPIATVSTHAERRHLDDGVHRVQEVAIVADNDRAGAPVGQQIDDGSTSFSVEVVGGLIEDEKIWLREHERRQSCARALTTGEFGKPRVRICFEAELGQDSHQPLFKCPICGRQLSCVSLAARSAIEHSERLYNAEQARDRFIGRDLHRLPQHSYTAIHGDRAATWLRIASDKL